MTRLEAIEASMDDCDDIPRTEVLLTCAEVRDLVAVAKAATVLRQQFHKGYEGVALWGTLCPLYPNERGPMGKALDDALDALERPS